jgi:hypothetical protein
LACFVWLSALELAALATYISRYLISVPLSVLERPLSGSSIIVPSTLQSLRPCTPAIPVTRHGYLQNQQPLLHSIETFNARMAPFPDRPPLPFLVAFPRPHPFSLPPLKRPRSSRLPLLSPVLPMTRKFSPHQLLSPDITVLFHRGWETSFTSYRPQRTPALARPYPLQGNPCKIEAFSRAWIASAKL